MKRKQHETPRPEWRPSGVKMREERGRVSNTAPGMQSEPVRVIARGGSPGREGEAEARLNGALR
jgi:hypothetical protein